MGIVVIAELGVWWGTGGDVSWWGTEDGWVQGVG